ncbi:MAG: class I mannose-6-phosphate isomerase [Bryobacteraceae bacterium]
MIERLPPLPVEKPEWGSTKLEPWFPNSPVKIGEVWFEGPPGSPLLIKFLFTTAALSVQVHPQDDYAAQYHQSRGKTEMWHILAADPGAKIAAGFWEPVTPEHMRAAAESGEIEQLLTWYEARPGDTFFIPAGTVHAIGGGLTLCEIQQMSDITYRLYDYGRPRELHLDHGVCVSDLGPRDVRIAAREGRLVECPYFTTEKYFIAGRKVIPALDRDQNLIVLQGAAEILGRPIRAGEVFRIPAGDPPTDIAGHAAILRTWAP